MMNGGTSNGSNIGTTNRGTTNGRAANEGINNIDEGDESGDDSVTSPTSQMARALTSPQPLPNPPSNLDVPVRL